MVGNTNRGEHKFSKKKASQKLSTIIMRVFHNRKKPPVALVGPIDGCRDGVDDVAAWWVDEIGDWLGFDDGVVGGLEWLVWSMKSRSGLVEE